MRQTEYYVVLFLNLHGPCFILLQIPVRILDETNNPSILLGPSSQMSGNYIKR